MSPSFSRSKIVFVLASAVAGAAAIDPLVERMSNAGVFGSGSFTDHSNLDVLPAFGVAAVLSLVFVIAAARRMLSRSCFAPAWLRNSAHALDGGALPKLIPAIFCVQLVVLFSMETLEQIAIAGHPMSGLLWLGGPPLISLLMHAAGCTVSAFALARVLHWSAQTLADAVFFVRRLYAQRNNRSKPRSRRSAPPLCCFLEPVLARLQGRAPPYLVA
jgi:hypothetical protein